MTGESDQAQVPNQECTEECTEGQTVRNYQDLSPEDQIIALSNDLGEALTEVNQNRDSAQRAQAELVNYRKRADEERISLQQHSNGRLIVKLLPVVDELGLAIDHADQSEVKDPWVEGIRLIQRKVSNLLESEGVSKIESIGAQFDPLEHEAVGTQETDQILPGHIVEVTRNGYRLHDRVIQPAQVVVAREISKSN
mgnify:FL=1|tara:strand:- start:345 stop:932 length:588 start_codon:yes stop_codon:yes gene_type:complete